MAGAENIPGDRDKSAAAARFWNWFLAHKDQFKAALTESKKARILLDELINEMKPFNPRFQALAGPYDEHRSELIITADGDIALFCKVEELVQAAPPMNDWKITAHKPPIGLERLSMKMYGYEFSPANLSFYPIVDDRYPDEINIVLVHPDFDEKDKEQLQSAGMIYLDNGLGELNTATLIDSLETKGRPGTDAELIPIIKLEEYLRWRQKEFIEKYEKVDAKRPEESFAVLESSDTQGRPLYAVINTAYHDWEFKAAFPWCVQIDIPFNGGENGLPDKKQLEELQSIEDIILGKLSPGDALYLGHETHNHLRLIYAYVSDFNEVSKKIHRSLEQSDWSYEPSFFIRKDKYWRNMEWFFTTEE